MLTRYRIEMKYVVLTLALVESLIVLNQMQAFHGMNGLVDDLFALMSGLGFVGIFIVGVIGNASLLLHIPYTVPLLSLALSGASLNHMLWMGVASGLGAAFGELFSYALTLKMLGGNATLQKSGLLQWVKRTVNAHPRVAPLLLFIWAVSPLPDDTVIMPLAMVRYGMRQIFLPIAIGKIIHNLGICALFYYFTSWSAGRISTSVQVDLALGILIIFVMIILYQVEKARAMGSLVRTEYSQ